MTTTATYHVPDDRAYDGASHLWIRLESETGRAVVGIDAFGLDSLGELAYISLQPVGGPVRRGEPIGMLEAAKMTTVLIAPVSGTLVDRNADVLRDPALVNRDPYNDGWLVVIKPSDWDHEIGSLITGEALPGWVAAETERHQSEGWAD
ncbi:MAG: glycine cleavage system protein H [Ardenticatenaceae bacterium]|nr:glycine cleavage system protein H [Ardenticatenaceae bacterium]HBY94906.1 glycine cleavage system protein H [Chloroflexota bacterium]